MWCASSVSAFEGSGGYFITLRCAGHLSAAARGNYPSCDILYKCKCLKLEACSKSWLKLFVYTNGIIVVVTESIHALSAENSGYRKHQNKVDHKSPVGKNPISYYLPHTDSFWLKKKLYYDQGYMLDAYMWFYLLYIKLKDIKFSLRKHS